MIRLTLDPLGIPQLHRSHPAVSLGMKSFIPLFIGALALIVLQPLHAQSDTSGPVTSSTTTTTTTANFSSSASQAVDLAQQSVDASVRDHLVSVYGTGTPTAINRWWVIFYDPSVTSHGRAVKIENGQVTKTYEAQGGVVYQQDLTFKRDHVTGENAALENARNYATQQNITYDSVRALLRRNSTEGQLRWRVELMNAGNNKGFVFTNSANGSFAMYSPAGSTPTATKSSTGGLVGDAKQLGNDVKHTFLGIGGDLQEFFTGERTVDQ